jgi:hypothetical protein
MEIPTNSQEALNLLPTNTQRPLISGMVPSREETLVSHTEYTNYLCALGLETSNI